jgi:hypothetical protein
LTCSARPRRRANPSSGRRSRSKVSLLSSTFSLVDLSFGDSLPTLPFFARGFQAYGPPWVTRPPRLRPGRRSTTPLNRSWRSCGPPPSRPAKGSRRARHRPGARWRAACAPSGGTSPSACAVLSILASGRPSEWWGPITRWTSRPCPPATLSRSASRMRRR